MEEEIEKGISLGDILKLIFSQKWLALLIAAIITLAGTFGLYFLGKKKVEYVGSFVLKLPEGNNDNLGTLNYPDGESFYYTDLINSDNLAKASEAAGGNIDIGEMKKKGDISIKRVVDSLVESDTSKDKADVYYTISVKASYFANEDVAREFIKKLAEVPVNYIKEMTVNYDRGLSESENAVMFDEQLNLLKNQTIYIQSKYEKLIEAHGGEFIFADGKTLSQRKNEVDAYLDNDMFAVLKNIASREGYIKKDPLALKKCESDLYSIERSLNIAKIALEKAQEFVKGTGNTNQQQQVMTDAAILSLTREIATLTVDKDILTNYKSFYEDATKSVPDDYLAQINEVKKRVEDFTKTIGIASSAVYEKVTKVSYLKSNVISVEGGTGIITSLGASLAVGLVVGAIAAYIVGASKNKKTVSASQAPIMYAEARLQAAATDESDKKE